MLPVSPYRYAGECITHDRDLEATACVVMLQYTPFYSPQQCKILSECISDTNLQVIKNVHMGILLLLVGSTSASMSLFFATLHKPLAPSGKDFDSSMIFIELLELDKEIILLYKPNSSHKYLLITHKNNL